jgi:hypothetical protein
MSIFVSLLFVSKEIYCSVLTKTQMLATPKDTTASIFIVAVFAFVAILGAPKIVMDSLIAYPTAVRAGWLISVLALAFNKYYLSAVLLAVLGLRIAMDTRASYAFSNAGIMGAYAELQKNDPRFAGSLDVKIADGALTMDPPRWLDPGQSPLPLLLFPPSVEQLEKVQSNVA